MTTAAYLAPHARRKRAVILSEPRSGEAKSQPWAKPKGPLYLLLAFAIVIALAVAFAVAFAVAVVLASRYPKP
jgi:hypothetical protein